SLALLGMSNIDLNFHHPAQFNLSPNEFIKLKYFQKISYTFFNVSTYSMTILGSACILYCYLLTSLYWTDPIPSVFWSFTVGYAIYFISAVVSSNLVAFVIVAKYIHIKQKSI